MPEATITIQNVVFQVGAADADKLRAAWQAAQARYAPQLAARQVELGQALGQALDQWAQQAKSMLDQYDPSLAVLLQPIAQAGMDLARSLQEKAQRSGMARGSPVVPPNAPPNPAAGPPQPAGM